MLQTWETNWLHHAQASVCTLLNCHNKELTRYFKPEQTALRQINRKSSFHWWAAGTIYQLQVVLNTKCCWEVNTVITKFIIKLNTYFLNNVIFFSEYANKKKKENQLKQFKYVGTWVLLRNSQCANVCFYIIALYYNCTIYQKNTSIYSDYTINDVF